MNGEEAKALTRMTKAVDELLRGVGENIEREGLLDTPSRVANMYLELTAGLREPPPNITMFDKGPNDQMVTLLDISYSSLCEHHFLPFIGKVHIGYIPNEKIAGLSKFARVIDWFSRRPQIQEQLTAQIADHIMEVLEPLGVIVVVEGTHLCMSVRGVKKPDHITITSAIRGALPKDEFFDILKMQRG